MDTAAVTTEGDVQTVCLPKGYHIPTAQVQARHEGDAIVLEPLKPLAWPPRLFEKIHISDPSFVRLDQGGLRPVKAVWHPRRRQSLLDGDTCIAMLRRRPKSVFIRG